MQPLKDTSQDFALFLREFSLYGQKRLGQAWTWFEGKKDVVVTFLVAKRGLYQRPFLHSSFFVLVGVAIVIAPLVANSYPSSAADTLFEFTPPSAVLSSFDEQETITLRSERPRDAIITHTVKEGDTLAAIAATYNVSVDSVKWLNTALKGDDLAIGQEVFIPPVTGIVHKVTRGETIYSIAKKYQTEAQNILNWPFNDFTDLDTFSLTAGQIIIVPDGVMPKAKPIYLPQMIAQVGLTPGDGQFFWPSAGKITQRPVSYHMALDIANNTLPPVAAADGGKVVKVEYSRVGYGYHVIVDHNNGYQTLYAHLSEIYVSDGQGVSKGSIIGKVGSTGRSSGPHLHFEVRKNGVAINPYNVLK